MENETPGAADPDVLNLLMQELSNVLDQNQMIQAQETEMISEEIANENNAEPASAPPPSIKQEQYMPPPFDQSCRKEEDHCIHWQEFKRQVPPPRYS